MIWRDLIGLHSWLQRYKSRIGVTPDPSHRRRNHGGSGGWCPPMFSDSYIARLNFIAPLYQTIFLHPCFLPLADGLVRQTTTSPPSFFSVLPPPLLFSLVSSLPRFLSLPLLLSFLSQGSHHPSSLVSAPSLLTLVSLPFLFLFSLFLCKILIFLSVFIPTARVIRIQVNKTVENNVSEAIKCDKHYFLLSRKCYLSILV